MGQKISVIIPVYKVERYLRQCLDSVVEQTYKNLEILLIDDGSPDNCGAICDEYAVRDERIRVTHKQNGGLCAAWNDGLAMVTGEYITFVDSDDWLELDYFEQCAKAMQSDSPDVLLTGRYFHELPTHTVTRLCVPETFMSVNGSKKDTLTRLIFVREKIGNKDYGGAAFVWGKFYKTAFIRAVNLTFDAAVAAGSSCDSLFNIAAFSLAKIVKGCSYGGYHYRKTNEQSSRKYRPDRLNEEEYVLKRLWDSKIVYANSPKVSQALQSFTCAQILAIFSTCYFHPDSQLSYSETATLIKEIKKSPIFHDALFAKNHPGLTWKQKTVLNVLRLPLVWPLDILFCFAMKKLYRRRYQM